MLFDRHAEGQRTIAVRYLSIAHVRELLWLPILHVEQHSQRAAKRRSHRGVRGQLTRQSTAGLWSKKLTHAKESAQSEILLIQFLWAGKDTLLSNGTDALVEHMKYTWLHTFCNSVLVGFETKTAQVEQKVQGHEIQRRQRITVTVGVRFSTVVCFGFPNLVLCFLFFFMKVFNRSMRLLQRVRHVRYLRR